MVGNGTTVRVTEDGMEAYLYLEPKADQSDYTREELKDYLRECGVVFGFIDSNIAAMCAKRIYGREIKVAAGTLYELGTEGHYEFFFDLDIGKKTPKIREDGSVDYQSMSVLNNVEEGQLLAIYHPSMPGRPGYSVMGKEAKAPVVRELPPLRVVGCNNSEDKNRYVATTNGKLEFDDGKLSVLSVHSIVGDVDLITGRIEFFGDVVITGNVETGVVIRTGKSLTIEGTVEAVEIYCGGDLVLKRGIQGNNKAKIVCKKDVYAEFIEHAEIEALGNVQSNVILNSSVQAGGKVILTGKKGLLLGGRTHADKAVVATNLGNQVETKTYVHVGMQPEMIERRLVLNKLMMEVNEEINTLAEDMVTILRRRQLQGLSKMEEIQLTQLKTRKEEIFQNVNALKQEMGVIENLQLSTQGAFIRVEGNIFRGVTIAIDASQLFLEKNDSYMQYTRRSGMIEGEVIAI